MRVQGLKRLLIPIIIFRDTLIIPLAWSLARYADLDSITWYDKNIGRKTHPVALETRDEFGVQI